MGLLRQSRVRQESERGNLRSLLRKALREIIYTRLARKELMVGCGCCPAIPTSNHYSSQSRQALQNRYGTCALLIKNL